jgi:hypothetical protein
MDILFICGSLEPGRDGVGDYSRRLACELIRQGHNISIISLFDKDVCTDKVDMQRSDGVEISVLRISSLSSIQTRMVAAAQWVNSFNPSIISLQFVVFSFQKKGLPIWLGNFLKDVGNGRRWHVMLHELWVGMPIGASKTHVLWGWFQRRILFLLIRQLNPLIVHTQSKLYQAQLTNRGVPAAYLPLFSNIPLYKNDCQANERDLKGVINLVIFGTIHPNSRIDTLIKEVLNFRESQNREVCLILMGRCGKEQETWTRKWQLSSLRVIVLGDQSPEVISYALKTSSIGINTGAFQMIDKSGTVAAMLDHGLPILCVSKPWKARGINEFDPPQGIFKLRPGCLQACLASKPINRTAFSVGEVAKTLVNSLTTFQNE